MADAQGARNAEGCRVWVIKDEEEEAREVEDEEEEEEHEINCIQWGSFEIRAAGL